MYVAPTVVVPAGTLQTRNRPAADELSCPRSIGVRPTLVLPCFTDTVTPDCVMFAPVQSATAKITSPSVVTFEHSSRTVLAAPVIAGTPLTSLVTGPPG